MNPSINDMIYSNSYCRRKSIDYRHVIETVMKDHNACGAA